MLKNHKLISFFIGLGFLIVLQKFATPIPVFRFLVPAFVVFSFAITFYNRRYLKQTGKYNFWILIRPLLMLASGFGIFLVLPNQILRSLFLIVTVGIITLFEIVLGNQAENLLLNETLIIAFGIIFYFFASYHYAPAYEPLYLIGLFCGIALLSRSFYEFTPTQPKTKMVGAITLGLFCSQLFWTLNFLQFHFSALSLILFNLFYFCLALNYYHLFHTLNSKKLQFHFVFMLACIFAVLIFTPWNVIG